MKTQIKASNVELTEALKDYIQKKMDHLDRFANHKNATAYVEIEKTTNHHKKGEVFRAEVNVELGGDVVRVEKTTPDLYKSIDKIKDEMEVQLANKKDKAVSLRRRETRK